ncbi:hypothetical protein LEP1GSC050_0042 [Leptospira phage vB_LbrZ_5399-LE1]|uniref:LBL_2463 family protein n=1 Tax=Leptospira inadai TaxID=29506 RepID=UPI000288F60C|nr:hypothetical protein [Leptospira inadai]AGS80701.1 hypothetical protein LEP1GSC050_0042 [Leptospira phage vB_LbrZ_5399-LE1]AGS80816.1 hypothetical protein LEP1GSC047_0829 [Leptospira phage vB_LinZ_10-LE1]
MIAKHRQLLSFEEELRVDKFQIRIAFGNEDKETLARLKEFNSLKHIEGGYSQAPKNPVEMDPYSIWIYVLDRKGELLSTQRVVEKREENLLPIELAVSLANKCRYAVLEENVADWNSVSFIKSRTGWEAAVKNFAAIAKLCLFKKYTKVYGFYNKETPAIERIYKKNGAVDSLKYPGDVFLPGYYLRGEVVKARIIELDKNALQRVATQF